MFPAARIGDMHVCPMVTGLVPHVGGPVMPPGWPTVLIAGIPAARATDMVTCTGPPDVIIMGSSTVLIGGKPAASVTSTTAHGGTITLGAPTVLIGGPSVVLNIKPLVVKTGRLASFKDWLKCAFSKEYKFSDHITVKGDLAFRLETRENLRKLYGTNSGRALLNSLETSGNSVKIHECAHGNDAAGDGPNWADPDLFNGRGKDAYVKHNPYGGPLYNNGSAWDNPDPAVTLGHELTHASHIANGNLPGDITSGSKVPNDPVTGLPLTRALEERRTTGLPGDAAHNLPDYSNEPFSENAIRNELGEPPRTSYLNPDQNLW